VNLAWLLVAAVAVVITAVTRIPRRVALLFLVLVFAFLWRPLTQDVTIVPADVLKLLPPWSELRPPNRAPYTKYEVSNLNLHDVPMQIVPWQHQVRESWRAGKVPLWNASVGCGMPLMANGQSTPFSPFHLITVPLPLAHALNAEAALKLFVALVLTYLFCKRRYSMLAAVMAAIAYGFSSWMITWLQFPIATAAALLPGVLLGIDLLMSGERRGVPIFLFALTVLSGHPETVFNIGLIAAAYGLWLARGVRVLLRVVGACVLAALICSPFLVPFAEAVTRSQRYAEMHARTDVTPPFSDRASAMLLLQPRFFGELPIERPWGPTTLESICGFAGVLAIASVIAAAIFIVRERNWRGVETLHVLGAIVCLGIILGWPGITQIFHGIAGLAPPMRMRLGICWFASLCIAPVVDRTRRDSALPLLIGALSVSLLMLWLMRTTVFPSESHRASALLSLLPSIGVLLSITLTAFDRRAIFLAGALTIPELWITMSRWNPILPARELHPTTPLIAKLATLRGPHRIVGLGGQLYPNVNAFWGLDDVRVHDPMANARYVNFLANNVGWNRDDYYAKWNDASSPLLDRLNVRYIVSDRELPGRTLIYQGRDGWIYENATARPRFYSDAAEVTILRASDDAYRLRVRAKRHALVASSVANFPGWRASVPLFETNGPFLGFMVPPGEHVIDVEYEPRSFSATLPLSLLTIAAVATAPVLSRRRRRLRPQ
jgi:hypothetical protein